MFKAARLKHRQNLDGFNYRLQSSEMHEALQRCHAPTHHIVYDDLGHGDFVIDWQVSIHV